MKFKIQMWVPVEEDTLSKTYECPVCGSKIVKWKTRRSKLLELCSHCGAPLEDPDRYKEDRK